MKRVLLSLVGRTSCSRRLLLKKKRRQKKTLATILLWYNEAYSPVHRRAHVLLPPSSFEKEIYHCDGIGETPLVVSPLLTSSKFTLSGAFKRLEVSPSAEGDQRYAALDRRSLFEKSSAKAFALSAVFFLLTFFFFKRRRREQDVRPTKNKRIRYILPPQ